MGKLDSFDNLLSGFICNSEQIHLTSCVWRAESNVNLPDRSQMAKKLEVKPTGIHTFAGSVTQEDQIEKRPEVQIPNI